MLEYEQYRLELLGLEQRIADLEVSLDIKGKNEKIAQLEEMATASDFWDDMENSQKILQQTKQLKDKESCLVIGKKRGILTPDFIFGKGTGAVIPYEEIVWAYKQDAKRNFIQVNSYLIAATVWMGAQSVVDLNKPDKTGCIGDALAVIGRRNPQVLLGYTNENRKAYKEAVKAAK